MLWDETTNAAFTKVLVGYRYNPTVSLIPNVPRQYPQLRFDKAMFNVGLSGVYIVQVSDSVSNNASNACNSWKKTQPSLASLTAYKNSARQIKRRLSCPCCIQQTFYDGRYQAEDGFIKARVKCVYKDKKINCPSLENVGVYCIQRKNVWFTSLSDSNNDKYAVVTRCCYDSQNGGLIKENGIEAQPLTQNYFKVSKLTITQLRSRETRDSFRNDAILQCLSPYQSCCVNSAKCADYQSRTIIPTCENYKAPKKCKHRLM